MCKPFFSFSLFLLIPFVSYAEEIPLLTGHLSNGLTYYIHHDPQAKSQILLDFIVKAGSLDEKNDERGFSHLLEHYIESTMYFKGKKIIDPYCAIWDATLPDNDTFTSYAFTQYHFEISRAIPRGLEEGLLGFSKTLSLTSLDNELLQELRNDVLDELREKQESPMEIWKRLRISSMYPAYVNNPFENHSSLSQATLENLYPFYRKYYQPGRIAVIVIGNIDLQGTKNLIEKHFGSIPASQNGDSESRIGTISQGTLVYTNQKLGNTFLSLSKPLPQMSQREILMLSICTQLLGQHLRSSAANPKAKFSQPLLELLTYPRMLRLTVSLPENREKGIYQLKESLQAFFNHGITEEQVDSIKAGIRNSLTFLQKKGKDLSLGEFYRDHFILHDRSLETDHPYLRTSLLDTIHAEDINQMLQSFEGFSRLFRVCL
jgi:zinc protease